MAVIRCSVRSPGDPEPFLTHDLPDGLPAISPLLHYGPWTRVILVHENGETYEYFLQDFTENGHPASPSDDA